EDNPEKGRKWEHFARHLLEKNPLSLQQNFDLELYKKYLWGAFTLDKDFLLDTLLVQAPPNFDINGFNYDDRSLLWKAVDYLSVNCVEVLLLKHDANPHHKKSMNDQSPYELFCALKHQSFSEDDTIQALQDIEDWFQLYDKKHQPSS